MQKHNLNTTKAVIFIKNMISNSCIKIVKQELERTGFIEVINIKLGEAEVQFDSQVINLEVINTILKREGFELVKDNASKLVERIKSCIIQHIFFGNNANSIIRNSDYLSESRRPLGRRRSRGNHAVLGERTNCDRLSGLPHH